LVYYHKSLEIAEISDLLNEKADAYDQIAATYKSMRNFEKAEEYLSKYIETYKLIQKNNQQKETDFLEVAYIGDDENDIECMKLCGISACPSDAVEMVQNISDYVCVKTGGDGAVREFIEYLIAERI
jgi:3-deoxy-D-manno-octulosonate 8-phosphate phosphatase (KDO 8-P phosphatase)